MANFMDQVQYYRELANAYSATMLENIAFYKAMMANQISTIMASTKEYATQMIANMGKNRALIVAKAKQYYSWCKEMGFLVIQKGIAGFQYAYSSFIYYCKEFPGWVKDSTIWLLKKFKQGFVLGYDLLCKLGNLFVDLTTAIWHFVINFPYYLQKTWNFVTAVANVLKDLTIDLMKAGWSKITQAWKFVVNMASKLKEITIQLMEKYLPKLVNAAKIAWQFVKQIPHYLYNMVVYLKDLAIDLINLGLTKFTQAIKAIWQFTLNLPHYISQSWQLVVKVAGVLKDAAVILINKGLAKIHLFVQSLGQFVKLIPHYLSKCWHITVAAVKSMTSTFINLASKAINYVLPMLKTLAHKAFSKLAMGLGMTFGICAAIVDLLFEGLGFIAQNTIAHLLPNLGNLAAIVAPLKAGLAFGLAGLGVYGAYVGGKKLVNFAKTLFAAEVAVEAAPALIVNPVVAEPQPVLANENASNIVPLFNAQRAQANQADRLPQEPQAIEPQARLNAAAL